MPYPSVSSLPASVKRGLSDKEQRQWQQVFNSAYKACQDKGGKDCDGSAYAQANGVVKKKKSLDDTWDVYSKQISQETAGYNAVGGDGEKACANCNWFSSPDGCILVQGDVSPTGLSNLWREKVKYEMQPMPVYIVEDGSEGAIAVSKEVNSEGGSNPLPGSAAQGSIVDKVKSFFANFDLDTNRGNSPIPSRAIPAGRIFLLKDINNDRTRVMMRVSNHFQDRHGEIITTEAHKEYEEYVDRTGNYPEFWLWHIPGSRWGQADFVSYADGFLTVSGLVDKGYEGVAEKLASRKDVGVSHGLYAVSFNDDSYIDAYRTFECSPLPLDQAANQWNPIQTVLTIAKEAELPIPQAKRDFAIKDLGIPESVIDTWEKENKDFGDGLKDLGISYKSKEGDEPKKKEDGATDSTPAANSDGSGTATTSSFSDSPFTIDAIRAAIREELKPTQDAVAAIEEKQKAYEGGLQKAVSDVITNGSNGAAPKGFDPTTSQKNVSNPDDAKADDDWFEKVVSKGESY